MTKGGKIIESTAIILAGGKSSRMGFNDKSFLTINGVTIIERIVNQLKNHFDEIIIGANQPEKYNHLGLKVVTDFKADIGPLMGLYSCLVNSKHTLNFVTTCDVPDLNIDFIRNMFEISEGYDMIIPMSKNNRYEPLHAVYCKSIAPKAIEIIEKSGRRISDLFDICKVRFVNFDGNDWYSNLNTTDDYQEYINKRL